MMYLESQVLFAPNDQSFSSLKLISFSDETMCGDPEKPLYSSIERISDRHIVYACLKGYKMEEGNPRRECVNGVWTGPPPPRCSGNYHDRYPPPLHFWTLSSQFVL